MDEHPATPPPDGGACAPAAPLPSPPRRILVVDDSASIRTALRETIAAMPGIGEIVEAADGVEGLAALAKAPADLVISDVTMPRLDGFKFLSAVRGNPRLRDVMVIMLSSHGESVDKVRGLTMGANDYVTKPFERGELQARVMVMLKMKELQEELQRKNLALERLNGELERLANLDGLTGLPNRRSFFARLETEFYRTRRLKNRLALLMLDIDHFKGFNDRYGHQAGDEALRVLARALGGGVRTYDLAGRYGGEEFIAFLPETDGEKALHVAERLRASIGEQKVAVAPETEVRMTVSVGIACWPDIPVERVDDLVAAADRALYAAKEGGRNRCVLARP